MKINPKRIYVNMRSFLLMFCCILAFASCGSGEDKANMPTLTVTVEPLRYFTEAIAGNRFRVVSMVPDGNNPETYDPTPQQLVLLSKSRACFRIGYIGFERTWMDRLKDNMPNLVFYDMSAGIELIHDEGHRHANGENVDPHIWNSVTNARLIAENVCSALCELDSSGQEYYRNRMDSLSQVFNETELQIGREIATADQAFLIFHPALSYFARDYGLKQICIEENGKEPSPAHLKVLIGICRKEGIRTAFIQQEFDRRNAELIANELNLKLVTINPLSYHWDREMLRIAISLNSNRSTQTDGHATVD